MNKCSRCGGLIGGSPSVLEYDTYRHCSPLDCVDVLRIERNALLLQIEVLKKDARETFDAFVEQTKKQMQEKDRLNGEYKAALEKIRGRHMAHDRSLPERCDGCVAEAALMEKRNSETEGA